FVVLAASLAPVQAATLVLNVAGDDTPFCGSTSMPCGSLAFTLRERAQPNDIFKIAPGVYLEGLSDTIHFNATHIRDVTIMSATHRAQDVIVDRNFMGRLFDFGSGAGDVRISGLTFIRGGWHSPYLADNDGGLMRFTGASNTTVQFDDCVFDHHRVDVSGVGGVGAINAGSPEFHDCVFRDSWASSAGRFIVTSDASPKFVINSGCYDGGGTGGAVETRDNSTTTWFNCTFRNNTSDYGGAVAQKDSSIGTLSKCTLTENSGRGCGGAHAGFGQAFTQFFDCEFTDNHVPVGSMGQDFFLTTKPNARFSRCSFVAGIETSTGADGGCGSLKDSTSLVMINCVVSGYRSTRAALAIDSGGTALIESSVFHSNDGMAGGGIFVGAKTTIRNCTFRDNRAISGGGIFVLTNYKKQVTVVDSLFDSNLALSSGGAIYSTVKVEVTVRNTRFTDNISLGRGGAIPVARDSTSIISNSTFTRSIAPEGGAIWSEGFITATNSTFTSNALTGSSTTEVTCSSTSLGGGAIYSTIYSLTAVTTSNAASTKCQVPRLLLSNPSFDHNDAGIGPGGGIYVYQQIPSCVTTRDIVCSNCTFTSNHAGYGDDVATIATGVVLQNASFASSWQLMMPNTIELGASDALGQPLAGAHAPVRVHMRLEPLSATARLSSAHFVGATSFVIRNGQGSLKSAMLAVWSNETNLSAQELNLTCIGDTKTGNDVASAALPIQSLTVPITLLGCSRGLGPDGRCAVETADGSNDIAAIVVFVGAASIFVVIVAGLWLFRIAKIIRVMRTMAMSMAATTVWLALDVADLASDALVLWQLKTCDFELDSSTFAISAYVVWFALATVSSVLVIARSVIERMHEWPRKAQTIRSFTKRVLVGRKSSRAHPWPVGPTHTPVPDMAGPTIMKPGPLAHDVVGLTQMEQRLNKHVNALLRRNRAVKFMSVRMVVEDMVLLLMHIHLYINNIGVSDFVGSRLRVYLVLAISISGFLLGMQVQVLVVWLDSAYVDDMRERIDFVRRIAPEYIRVATRQAALRPLAP
ncbi:TPA: hypothetical protein N0F65_005268, partial [Lagenidium giganteum]